MKKVSIAYSPDSDDAFMMYALEEKIVPWGDFSFSFFQRDIQELNNTATKCQYDVSAISIGAYAQLVESYQMLPIGCSIGESIGPAIVCKQNSHLNLISDLKGKKIAFPGKNTSVYSALKIVLPFEFEPVFANFLEIEPMIKDGSVDAGVLIHELQLVYEQHGLRKIDDVTNLWKNHFNCPLPLGANAIRRSLIPEDKAKILGMMKESIQYALENYEEAMKWTRTKCQKKFDFSEAEEKTYIDNYVSAYGLSISSPVQSGIKKMLSAQNLSHLEIENAFYLG